ncbi:outer membrane lipoprotein carrier protein LolA [Treponema sp. OMZ 840]|uniref:LolA family protein n=1 Tax=Treponema sp. OMZ 840 TaxID=244313 RepID=UPI003D8DF340
MKKIAGSIFYLLLIGIGISAQSQILTVSAFFKTVSEKYAQIQDFEADMAVAAGKTQMQSHVSFKRPNLLRIDFSNPETQVIVFNGEQLTIYLPGPRSILSQSVESGGRSQAANLATPEGLALMRRYYSIAYETGQEPVALDADTAGTSAEEKVIKLILSRKSLSEGFQTIKLAINPTTLLIRRVEAVSALSREVFRYDFSNYVLNQNIPDTRFLYDAPSSANTYNNFLLAE